ncbi:MAG: hypothetical protein WD335_03615 [Candidatus Paceibacterota bacterium]
MNIDNKIEIEKQKLDSNLKLYVFLKEINGGLGLTENQLNKVLEITNRHPATEYEKGHDLIKNIFEEKIKSPEKMDNMMSTLYLIESSEDYKIFSFALKLLKVKPLLLEEAKISIEEVKEERSEHHLLSLEYDKKSKNEPYYMRVNGALLSLLFFRKLEESNSNFLSQGAEDYVNNLKEDFEELKQSGVEPNQMFMLMFSESVNQSIISTAGSSYEERIFQILVEMGIDADSIEKKHDEDDSSTEFDFFFNADGVTVGIGAKRTLRERYKQFIKTAQMTDLDVMIEITLGLDLRQNIAEAIRNHGVYLFVADEIYKSRDYLQKIDGVYAASSLSLDLIKSLKAD